MEKRWFYGLQSFRAILFIMVFISHSSNFFDCIGGLGAAAVEGFFILSGFLGGGYAYRADISKNGKSLVAECINSLWKKIKCFYPVYFVFLILFLPIKFSSWGNFIKCIFLTQSYWGNADTALAFNWPTWFLSSILLSYLLLPVISRFCKKYRSYSVFFILFIVSIQLLWSFLWRNSYEAYSLGYYMVYIFPVARMLDFIQGNFLYNIFLDSEKKDFKYINSIEILVFLIYIAELLLCDFIPEVYQSTFIWIPISMALVYIFAKQSGKVTKYIANNKTLLWIGKRSFEFFITHRIILGCFSNINSTFVSWILASITTVLVTILMYDWNEQLKIKFQYKSQKSNI